LDAKLYYIKSVSVLNRVDYSEYGHRCNYSILYECIDEMFNNSNMNTRKSISSQPNASVTILLTVLPVN